MFLLGEEISWNRPKDAIGWFREALPGLREAGRRNEAAGCAVQLASCMIACGLEGWAALVEEALELVDEDHPSPELVYTLQELAGMVALSGGDDREAVVLADRSLSAAEALGLPAPGALSWRGAARCRLGDRRGLDDMERAVEQARTLGATHALLYYHGNYACCLSPWTGPGGALVVIRENADLAQQAGMELMVLQSRMYAALTQADLGQWDEALAEATRLIPLLADAELTSGVALMEVMQATLLHARGRDDGVAAIAGSLARAAREGKGQAEHAARCYAGAAYAQAALGHVQEARALLAESLLVPGWVESAEPEVVRVALACGDPRLAQKLADEFKPLTPLHENALASCRGLLAEARGEHEAGAAEFTDASARWHDFGVPCEEAQALLGQGRCLVALGRALEAAPVLEQAREIFMRLGASPALDETLWLLGEATHGPRRSTH